MERSGRLTSFLHTHRTIAIDTNIFIYLVEEHPVYADLAFPIFKWLEHPGHAAVTSTITMTEVLTRPYLETSPEWVENYYKFLKLYPNLDWVAPDLAIADLAAQYRALHKMRTPDAIQAATAAQSGVKGFVSNDRIFRRVKALDTLLLEELI